MTQWVDQASDVNPSVLNSNTIKGFGGFLEQET